jgi:hypothetical protein
MVIDHFHCMEYLDLSSWPGFEFPTDAELSLPCLRYLKLGSFGALATPLMAPVLHQVVLNYFGGIRGSFFPWSQLTVITVEYIQLGEYGYLMNQLVNVVHCRLRINAVGNLR